MSQLTQKWELEPTCYSGRVEIRAGEIRVGEEAIPFTVDVNGEVILATGVEFNVGQALTYRREPAAH